jgi:hypothetical protein
MLTKSCKKITLMSSAKSSQFYFLPWSGLMVAHHHLPDLTCSVLIDRDRNQRYGINGKMRTSKR